ncbi:hypothetical protein C7Y47_01365 [Lysinibacillus sphaericus]|uniref:Uncharacterized protein n=1 Tax=Lysinibacillus sphaericus TaxID=1421 RepID=A0A544V0S6_LYSSH|nr:hypothetical protein [Lysinibacillus sp. SDF0037]TQR39708.1 hypothetical protein C7Y47_01365 [Lysinibacillus sp. SDF0037]
MKYKFTEVLNDLINYFILGDILLLERWKLSNNHSDNLAMEFTTNESGDNVVLDGIILPMVGIENFPYTIIFNLSDDAPELLKTDSRLQFKRDGYSLKVENNILMLFTWRILEQFTNESVHALLNDYRQYNRPMIEVENGWYSIEILGGETLQDLYYEPTFEFVLRKAERKESVEFDFNSNFTIESSTY